MKISGNIINILTNEIYSGTIITENGKIKEIIKDDNEYDNYILPPFIDSHVHIESSMLIPTEFARLASVHGTGACVSDPHEIANVLGIDGVYFMLDNADKTPFRFYFGAPSCVPATPFETAGGEIDSIDIKRLFRDERIKYLSEMMNVPGVIYDEPAVADKLKTALEFKRPVDGHAPMLSGDNLKKYIQSGISTDHEAITYEEGLEKIKLGMKIQIREGSAAKNFDELAPLMIDFPDMCMLCSDDLHPDDLAGGHINLLVKKALAQGIPLMNVLTSACVTPVKHYGLGCGLLQAGDSADFIIVDNLVDFNVQQTYITGMLCGDKGNAFLENIRETHVNNFNAKVKQPHEFAVNATETIDIITVTDGQLVTGWSKERPETFRGCAAASPEDNILKIAVVNRYEESKPAVAFVKNFGLKEGAIASSIAHDSHNIICVGCDDESMALAVNLIIEEGGGLSAVSADGEVVLPLPIAGLMTDADGYETAEMYQEIDMFAKSLGSTLSAPFMTLSFMALLVIPSLKLSDKGLFDGDNFKFVKP